MDPFQVALGLCGNSSAGIASMPDFRDSNSGSVAAGGFDRLSILAGLLGDGMLSSLNTPLAPLGGQIGHQQMAFAAQSNMPPAQQRRGRSNSLSVIEGSIGSFANSARSKG